MRKALHNNKGFALVELLILVVVLLAVGAVGVYAYSHSRHAKNAVNSSNTSHNGSTQTSQNNGTADPYKDWKSYCSSYGGVCFKYPADWTTSEGETSLPDQKSLTLTSPSGKVAVSYSPADQGVGGSCNPTVCSFDTVSLAKLSASNASDLEVVQGVWSNTSSSAIVPYYYVTSSAQVASQGLVSGQNVGTGFLVTEFPNPKVTSGLEHLAVRDPSQTSYSSPNAAKSWLSGSEVVTAGKILGSLEYR